VNADISLLVAGGGPAGIAADLQARELGTISDQKNKPARSPERSSRKWI